MHANKILNLTANKHLTLDVMTPILLERETLTQKHPSTLVMLKKTQLQKLTVFVTLINTLNKLNNQQNKKTNKPTILQNDDEQTVS